MYFNIFFPIISQQITENSLIIRQSVSTPPCQEIKTEMLLPSFLVTKMLNLGQVLKVAKGICLWPRNFAKHRIKFLSWADIYMYLVYSFYPHQIVIPTFKCLSLFLQHSSGVKSDVSGNSK